MSKKSHQNMTCPNGGSGPEDMKEADRPPKFEQEAVRPPKEADRPPKPMQEAERPPESYGSQVQDPASSTTGFAEKSLECMIVTMETLKEMQ